MIKKFLWLIFVFALCLGFTGTARAGLVAYYPFDGDVNDDSGNSKNGVYWSAGSSTATPSFVTGRIGQAISLQAFDSYDTAGVGGTRIYQGVILPDESFFDFANEISISCWVKFHSPMAAMGSDSVTQGAWAALVQRNRASGNWCLQTNWNTGAQRLSFRLAHTSNITSTLSVRPGTTLGIHLARDPENWDNPAWDTWYHVVTTYDSAGLATIYLNSEVNMTQQNTAADKTIVDRGDGGYNLAVGIGIYANSDYTPGGTSTSSAYSHDGLIDEVAIFDTALTDANVQFIYEVGIAGFISGDILASIIESGESTKVCEGGLLAPVSDTYTIKLYGTESGDPNVTVTLAYDSSQITVSPTSALITEASSWQAEITVNAVDDSDAEGPHNSTIEHTISCSDPNGADYNWGHDPNKLRDMVVAIRDDDIKSVIVTESGSTTAVAETFSTTDSYTVSLGGVPSASVVMSPTYDSDQITVSPTSLTFTTGNYHQAQTVTVTAVDDEVLESGVGDTHTTIIEGSCAGGGYDAIEVADVTVYITDDEPYCGDPNTTASRIVADLTGPEGTWDCYVDLYDLAKMAEEWLICNDPTDDGCDPNAAGTWPTI